MSEPLSFADAPYSAGTPGAARAPGRAPGSPEPGPVSVLHGEAGRPGEAPGSQRLGSDREAGQPGGSPGFAAPGPENAPDAEESRRGAAPAPAAGSEQALEARDERRFLLAWYCSLLGGILPVLLLGFLYSALADRLAFAGWALVVATLYTVLLRQGLDAGWPPALLAGILGLLLAAAFGWFAALERTHHEILDLGFRAVFPGLYHAAATRPSSAAILAGLLAVAGLGGLVTGFLRGRQA